MGQKSLNASNAARRKAEIAIGSRTDRRFVEKIVPNKRRKKIDKRNIHEMCEEN